MTLKRVLVLGITAFFLVISANLALSQEAIEKGGAVPEATTEPDTQWLWGEVVSIDIEKDALFVKYLDYEVDQEKEATIGVDARTTYENVRSLTEIKPKDTVSIDYIVGADGKNTAKVISVEKPEAMEAAEEGPIPAASATNSAE